MVNPLQPHWQVSAMTLYFRQSEAGEIFLMFGSSVYSTEKTTGTGRKKNALAGNSSETQKLSMIWAHRFSNLGRLTRTESAIQLR